MDTNKQVALTILEQLGGGRFLAMTGAKNLAFDGPSLCMKLPGKFRFLQVTLDPMDTYTMAFKNSKGETIKEVSGVYCDMLQKVFTSTTGLETRLF